MQITHIHSDETEVKEQDTYWSIMKNGFPTSLSIISQIIILTINYSRISDSASKAGLGLSGVLVHALGGSFVIGFDYGYAIFASRAFGAKNYEKFKLYFVQGLVNLIGVLAVFVIVCLFSYRVSILAGQQQQVSVYTYQFIVYILPGYVCFYASHFVRVFINSQNIYSPNFYVDASSIILHVIVSWIMSFFATQKILIIISTNITLICYFLIILFIERTHTPWKLSLELLNIPNYFQQYKNFLKECCFIGFPYALSVFIFQVVALFVGSFKNTPQTAGHVIVTNMVTIMVSPYLGFGLFMSTRIGYYVGKNNAHAVMDLVKKIIKFSLFISYILYAILIIFLDPIVNFYTTDQEVKYYMVPGLKFVGIVFVVDVLQNIGAQFYKAIGFGPWITKVYTISFYVIGFGSIYILSKFLSNQIISVWAGLMIGCIALSTFCGLKLNQIDMKSHVQELHDKVKNSENELGTQLNEVIHY